MRGDSITLLVFLIAFSGSLSACDRLAALVDGKSCSSDDDCFVNEACSPQGRCEANKDLRAKEAAVARTDAWADATAESLTIALRGQAGSTSHRIRIRRDGSVAYVCTRRCPQQVWFEGKLGAGKLASLEAKLRAGGFFDLPRHPEALEAGRRNTEVTLAADGLEHIVIYNAVGPKVERLDKLVVSTLSSIRWKGGTPTLLADAALNDREMREAEAIRKKFASMRSTIGSKCPGSPTPVWGVDAADADSGVLMLVEVADRGGVSSARFAASEGPEIKGEACVLGAVRGAKIGKFSAMNKTLEIPFRR